MPPRKLVRKSSTENKPISAQERSELRGVIRARVKALKVGIEERRSDQRAEIERQINARYAEQKAAFRAANELAAGLLVEVNRKMQEIYDPVVGDHPEYGGFALLRPAIPPSLERQLMRRRADREVDAAADTAYSRLVRWEADSLEKVARTGIQSSEAQALLDQVATIDMLMPTVATPPTAESVITEMVTSEGKMPWVSDTDLNYGLIGRSRQLEVHAEQWRESSTVPGLLTAADDDE